MAFSKAIFELLNQSTELTAIVGAKKYPLIVAQSEEMPYVAWSLSRTPTDTHDDVVQQYNYTVFIHSVTNDYDQAHEMDEILLNHLNGRSNETVKGYKIQSIHERGMVEAFEEVWDNFHIISTYQIKVNS